MKQCCGTDGVEANYIKTEILPPFFKHFWQHRMALDRRNYRQVSTNAKMGSSSTTTEELCLVGLVVWNVYQETERCVFPGVSLNESQKPKQIFIHSWLPLVTWFCQWHQDQSLYLVHLSLILVSEPPDNDSSIWFLLRIEIVGWVQRTKIENSWQMQQSDIYLA